MDMQPRAEHITTAELAPAPATDTNNLDIVDEPPASAVVALASGRRYELAAEPAGDRLTVRARNGAVVLRVLVTNRGPVLSFESADIEIAAHRRLALSADEIERL